MKERAGEDTMHVFARLVVVVWMREGRPDGAGLRVVAASEGVEEAQFQVGSA